MLQTMKKIVFVLILLVAWNCAYSANKYVRPTAYGTSGADWNNAWSLSSINWTLVNPGDTIWLAGGTYNNMQCLVNKSGTEANRIYIKKVRSIDTEATSAAGWNESFTNQVIVNPPTTGSYGGCCFVWPYSEGSYVTLDGRNTNEMRLYNPALPDTAGHYCAIDIRNPNIHDVSIYNCEVKGDGPDDIKASYHFCSYGGAFNSWGNGANFLADCANSNFVFSSCYVHGVMQPFTLMNNRGLIIEYCKIVPAIYDGVPPCTVHGNVFEAAFSGNLTLRWNEFMNWPIEGIMWGGGDLSGESAMTSFGPIYAYGNIWRHAFWTSYTYVARVYEPFLNTGGQGPLYNYNNTFLDIPAIWSSGNGGSWANVISRNNIYWNAYHAYAPSDSDYEFSEAAVIGSNSHQSPTFPFVNTNAGDYSVKTTSLAYNGGTPIANFGHHRFDLDMFGNQRTAGSWDIGAIQHSTGANTDPVIYVTPSSLDFGTVVSGQTSNKTFYVTNGGAGTLTGTITSSSARFTLPGTTSYNLSSNQGVAITVRYSPSTTSDSGEIRFVGTPGSTNSIHGHLYVAPTVYGTNVWVNLVNANISGGFKTNTAGQYIYQGKTTETNTTAIADGAGVASIQFSNSASGNYFFKAKFLAPSTGENSFWVTLTNGTTANTGLTDNNIWDMIPWDNTWQTNGSIYWRGTGTYDNPQYQPKYWSLGANGTNTLTIIGREMNAGLLAVMLVQSNDCVAPTIVNPPANLTVSNGQFVGFIIGADGTDPLSFTWRFQDGTVFGRSFNFSTNVYTANAGTCSVAVTNGCGAYVITNFTLWVTNSGQPPTIVSQSPSRNTATPGTTASLFVAANGTLPLTYQWKFNGTNLASATTSSYSIANCKTWDGGIYTVGVTNGYGGIVSSNMELIAYGPAVFLYQLPSLVQVSNGATATLSAKSANYPEVTYEWAKSNVMTFGEWFRMTEPSNNTNVITFGPFNESLPEQLVKVVIYNMLDPRATSGICRIVVTNASKALEITGQPSSITATQGFPMKLQVTLTGTDPKYQWRLDGADISGENSYAYGKTGFTTNDAGSYTVVVTNELGSVTSEVATVSALVQPEITIQPSSITTNTGSNAVFAVDAAGTATLAYQWSLDGSAVAGATDSSLTVATETNTVGSYTVVITNAGGSVTSSVAVLAAIAAPYWIAEPDPLLEPTNTTITLSCLASGTPTPSYQWYCYDVAISDSDRMYGTTSDTLYIFNSVTNDSGIYTLVATNISGSITSTPYLLIVSEPPFIDTNYFTVTRQNLDSTYAVFPTIAGNGPMYYTWYKDNVLLGTSPYWFYCVTVRGSSRGNYSLLITNRAGSVSNIVGTLQMNPVPVRKLKLAGM